MNLVEKIFNNQIAKLSGYVDSEKRVLESIDSSLVGEGYYQASTGIYQRGDRKVYVRLVDDITQTCDLDRLSPNDLLITDNFISRPVVAKILTLPHSWFGIYAHEPQPTESIEFKDYSFPVNRIDAARLELFLELSKRIHLHRGYVNFNCVRVENWREHDLSIAQQNWKLSQKEMSIDLQTHYKSEIKRLDNRIPYYNHAYEHDQILDHCHLNIVAETYGGDYVIALSEKIFSALVRPVPWILFGPKFAVTQLKKLGFDVLDDIIDHGYDTGTLHQRKSQNFIDFMLRNIKDTNSHKDRLQTAAFHNQNKLKNFRSNWENDFDDWLQKLQISVK